MTKFKMFFLTVKRDLLLFIQAPREYLYSFTYPSDSYITIEPYNPAVTKTGHKIINQINKLYPKLKVHFLGSADLGISGQRDIDLIADSSPADFDNYIAGLCKILGKPLKRRSDFIEWHTTIDDCSIELLLIHPTNPISAQTLKTHQTLKKSKKLQKEYEQIKLAASGVSVREYKRRRLEFFNRIENS